VSARGAVLGLAWLVVSLAATAAAQTPAMLVLDDVRVHGAGQHRVTVSVLDDAGLPCPDLGQAFRVSVDGRPVRDLRVRTGRQADHGAVVTLVVDAALLTGESAGDLREALDALGRSLARTDRVRVIAAGARIRSAEAPAASASRLVATLGGGRDATPRLYDALYDALRSAAARGGTDGAVVIAVTRGVDADSRHGALELLALARGPRRLTPLMVALVGGEGGEADRLRRLTENAGGTLTATTSSAGLGPVLEALARRGLDSWVLEFRDPAWDRSRPTHALSLVVERAGARRSLDAEYATATAVGPPWWRSPSLALGLVLVLGLAGAALMLTRRRQLGLLVHDRDATDGVWYELFAFPVTLGAAAGNDILLDDPRVSRNHAVLERRGRTVEVVDLNSENGTHVNGERVSRRALADGDRVDVGPDVHLIYEARG
jgi:hypothetical protein